MTDSVISTYTAEMNDGALKFVFQAKMSGTMDILLTVDALGQVLTFKISEYDWEKMLVNYRSADSDVDDINS